MSDYADQEALDLLKKWWREYGKIALVAILIGLAIGFGWRYWRAHQVAQAERASLIYQQAQWALTQQRWSEAEALWKSLMKQYAQTPYASLAAGFLAQRDVSQNRLAAAVSDLQWVIQHARSASVKQIARLRGARVLLAEAQPQAALVLLKTVDDPTYQPLIDSVKGDIYRTQGQTALAAASYAAAQQGFAAHGITDPVFNLSASSTLTH